MSKALEIFDSLTADPVASPEVEVGASKGTDATRYTLGGPPKTAGRPRVSAPQAYRYDESNMAKSDLEKQARQGEDAFFNDRQPHYLISREKPEHRIYILLKAQGYSIKEIAEQCGATTITVSNVLRQPWARLELQRELARAGRTEIQAMFKGAARDAAELLETIVNDEEAQARDRIAAAKEVLDRALGKASQPLEHSFTESQLDKMSDEDLAKIIAGGVTGTGTT